MSQLDRLKQLVSCHLSQWECPLSHLDDILISRPFWVNIHLFNLLPSYIELVNLL
jgi:hypothetical protein